MRRSLLTVALLLSLAASAAAETVAGTRLHIPYPAGWVMLPDGVTLVVSYPDKGQLWYFDTLAEKEAKKVEMDFQPTILAVQGDLLFAAAKGSSVVHVLDAKTGKEKKEIALGGDGVANFACHPTKGLLYASTATLHVYAVDVAAGTATKTEATGNFLAVDPVNAAVLFTGVQPPLDQDKIIVKGLPDGSIKIYFDDWGARAFVLKYAIDGKALKLVSSQKNAAVNAWSLNVTPDGKKVLMTSGGGWRPPAEGGSGGGYVAAAWSADKLESRLGETPTAANMTFHPVLNLGVLNHQGRDLEFFNPKSLVVGKKWHVSDRADSRALMAFGGKGTKVVFWNGDNRENDGEALHFLPLDLTADDRAALTKVYGTLPAAPKPVVEVPAAKGAEGVIAAAGFNNKKGINATTAAGKPYPLGQDNVRGGFGEKGWEDVWPANDLISFVTDPVGEGDGAVRMVGTINYGRKWTERQTGPFGVEVMVRSPRGGYVLCYVMDDSDRTTGPFWRVQGGKLEAMDGDGFGNGKWTDLGPCEDDKWYTVKVAVDPAKKTYTAAIDDGKPSKPLAFRYRPKAFQRINFLTENKVGIYLDAVRILAAKK